MNDSADYDLNHKSFVILGLVAEEDSHPYAIDQKVEMRGMRNWTNIGVTFSQTTIYRILDRLEEQELVESYSEEVDNRERKVYTLSFKGQELLHKKIYDSIANFYGKRDEDFYVAFSMYHFLPTDKMLKALEKSNEKMRNHIEELKEMLKENEKYPMNVRGLFIHPIKILETDIEFLEMVKKHIIGEKKKWLKSIK